MIMVIDVIDVTRDWKVAFGINERYGRRAMDGQPI